MGSQSSAVGIILAFIYHLTPHIHLVPCTEQWGPNEASAVGRSGQTTYAALVPLSAVPQYSGFHVRAVPHRTKVGYRYQYIKPGIYIVYEETFAYLDSLPTSGFSLSQCCLSPQNLYLG